MAQFIAKNSPHTPKVQRPLNWVKIGTVSAIVVLGATTAKLALPVLMPMFYSRSLWAALSLISILLFTSGHMFNHIRKVPYVVNNGRGGVSYLAGGFSNQYGLETQIVAIICTSFVFSTCFFFLLANRCVHLDAALAFATIALAMKTPRIEDPGRQKVAIMIWNAVMLCAFSLLMNLFKQKNGSYPFFLPPMM